MSCVYVCARMRVGVSVCSVCVGECLLCVCCVAVCLLCVSCVPVQICVFFVFCASVFGSDCMCARVRARVCGCMRVRMCMCSLYVFVFAYNFWWFSRPMCIGSHSVLNVLLCFCKRTYVVCL